MNRPVALLLGPNHHQLQSSRLALDFTLVEIPAAQSGPLALAAAIIRREAVLVHLSTTLTRGLWRELACVAAAKLLGARVLCQVYGRDPASGALAKRILQMADAVVESACAGIDCAPFQKYNRLSDPAAPLKLVYIGPLAREQGLYEAVEALRLARFRGVATRLVIAGGGPEEPRLRQRIRDLALSRDVAFTAPVEGEQKARLLSQADVLLLPGYGREFPRVLLEAMAAGAVPIATRTDATAEVASDGVHGHLVPARDPEAITRAIAALAGDRASLARMSAACRKRIAGAYSIERSAAELSQIYAALSAARSPNPVS